MTLNEKKLKLNDIADDRKMKLIATSVRLPSIPTEGQKITISEGTTRTELQKIMDSCSDEGGGTITIPAGKFEMDGPIELKSNVRLHLSDGATLVFTNDPNAYLPVVMSRYEGVEVYSRCPMIHAHWQENVAITGEGNAVIDINGHEMAKWGMTIGVENWEESIHGSHGETPELSDINRLREMGDKLVPLSERIFGENTKLRSCAVEFNSCSRVLLNGVTIKNCPFWCIHPLYCEDVTISNIKVESNYPNNDGISPESSRRVLIENCLFHTGDDAVAVKSGRDTDCRRIGRPSEDIVIRNCILKSKGNGICIGSEISGGVKNIYVSNIEVGDVKNGILFKSNLDRGGYIENVYVDSVNISSVAGAALRFETNYLHYRGGNFPTKYNNFRINNVSVGKSAEFAIFYEGNEAERITDIKVKNFNVDNAKWPYYLRNTKNCTFINCTVNKEPIPESPEESAVKRTCDVW
jgi:polygalacturonase